MMRRIFGVIILLWMLALSMPALVQAQASPDFSPFAGTWGWHGSIFRIGQSGVADLQYLTYDGSQNGPADVGIQLTSASGGTATGSVSSTTDPTYPVGTSVLLTLEPNDEMDLQIGGQEFQDRGLMCGPSAPLSDCGA